MKEDRLNDAISRLEELAMIEGEREGLQKRLSNDDITALNGFVGQEEAPSDFDPNDQYDFDTPVDILVLSDQLTKAEQEITGLRKLIRELRHLHEIEKCRCDEGDSLNAGLCGRCIWLQTIDEGLADIAKERDNAE